MRGTYEQTFDLIRLQLHWSSGLVIYEMHCCAQLQEQIKHVKVVCKEKAPPPFNLHRGPPFLKATTGTDIFVLRTNQVKLNSFQIECSALFWRNYF